MKRRGIENLLLRRVRRHQSMTALFRAPSSERPPRLQTRPVVQAEAQEPLVRLPIADTSSSIPVTPPRSNTVARQVVPASASTPIPFSPTPSAPDRSEPAKTPDPIWKRLQTIFRKHEEQENPPTKDMEVSAADPLHPQATDEEKAPEAPQAMSTEEASFREQNPTAAIPTAKTVQRSSENAEQKPASPNVLHSVEPLPAATPETTRIAGSPNTETRLPDKTNEVNDELTTDNEPEKPSLPLESVWNVQRVEATHPLFHQDMPRPTFDSTDENKASINLPQVSDQKPSSGLVQLHRADASHAETKIPDPSPTIGPEAESREPVESLSPRRPRPPQVDLPSSRASIQRRSQDSQTPQEVRETPPVNTAIGPLPADLWWLLGQKTPSAASTSQPDIQRTIHPDQKQAPPDQSNAAHLQAPAEQPVETPMPNTIQRQVLSREALPSTQQEPASSPRAEEPRHAEPDLDDLARRVYAEVRRRLAAEWERRR